MALKLDDYNEAVTKWDQDNNQAIKAKASAYGITHRADSPSTSPSVNKLRSKLFTKDGAIARVTKTFPRSLIYPHKGAGKGRGGIQGSRWVDRYNNAKTTNPKSLGKMGTGGRTAKPFINDALEGPDGVDELATIAAVHLGDALVGNLFIK